MGPFIIGVDGEVRNDGHISDFDFIEMLIDDHRWVEGVFSVSRDVVFRKVAPHELLRTKG